MNFTYNNSNNNCNFASYSSRNSKQNVDYSMVLGKPSSITYGKPLVNTSYSSRTLRIRTLLSRHGTIRTQVSSTQVSSTPVGWYGTLRIAKFSGSETNLAIFSIIRDDTNQELLPSGRYVYVQSGVPYEISIVRRNRLANPQTKLKIYWQGNRNSISTIQTITGLNLVDYNQNFNIIDSFAVKANYTVDSDYIENQPLTLIIKITLPPANTGFYGGVKVATLRELESDSVYIDAYLAYNDFRLTPTARINGNSEYIFIIYQPSRLPLPTSRLQLKITYQSGIQNITVSNYNEFEITSITNNPLNQETTISMLANTNNYGNYGEFSSEVSSVSLLLS